MTPKQELIKIQQDTERIKQIARDMVSELEAIDNEYLIREAERIANAK